MLYDIQSIIDMYCNCFLLAFPLGLVMLIAEKLIYIFQDFILGKKKVNL